MVENKVENKIKEMAKSAASFLFPFIIVIIIWEIIADFNLITKLPSPSQLLETFYSLLFQKQVLLKHLGNSFYRLIIGYMLAAGIGIAVGSLMGVKKSIAETFSPLLSLLIAVPTIAWVPVLLITLGLGDETVIAAIFLGGFFAIAYSTMNGIRMVDKHLVDAARIMGGGRFSVFFHVLLPGSLVSIIPGLRLAIGYSWRALVGAEMLAALVKWGIGKMIYEARFWNDVKTMFVGLVIIGITGLMLDRFLMGTIERKTVEKWGMVSRR